MEDKNFIFQGPPRKSNRPKKLKEYEESEKVNKAIKIEKRKGDYKEFPYYIKKDLEILCSLIKEMVVTNKSYDIGFPFRIIKDSKYMISMRKTFKDDFDKCICNLFYKLDISSKSYSARLIETSAVLEDIIDLAECFSNSILKDNPTQLDSQEMECHNIAQVIQKPLDSKFITYGPENPVLLTFNSHSGPHPKTCINFYPHILFPGKFTVIVQQSHIRKLRFKY